MNIIESAPPLNSLIAPMAARLGHYADCFELLHDNDIALAQFVTAFYAQWLFRAERVVLSALARAPSTDRDLAALASGTGTRFAVWTVRARTQDEVLLMQKGGHTYSWLQAGAGALRFGSVVVPGVGRGGQPNMSPVFSSLIKPHKLYSRALLAGAARRLGVQAVAD